MMKNKRIGIEGSPSAKMIQIIREYGFNEEMSIEVGTVISISPLSIHLESDGINLDRDDLIISEHLCKHDRSVNFKVGDVTVNKITFNAHLKKNDRVILIGDNDTQMYYLIDKVGVM